MVWSALLKNLLYMNFTLYIEILKPNLGMNMKQADLQSHVLIPLTWKCQPTLEMTN